MENASKALIMAAEILIGLLIISLAVYLFTSFGTSAAQINQRNANQQLAQFNTKYTTYSGRTDLTVYDIVTVANMAKENNTEYGEVNNYATYYEIIVRIGGQRIDTYSQTDMDELIQTNQISTKYKLQDSDIQYHEESGRIAQITFRVVN